MLYIILLWNVYSFHIFLQLLLRLAKLIYTSVLITQSSTYNLLGLMSYIILVKAVFTGFGLVCLLRDSSRLLGDAVALQFLVLGSGFPGSLPDSCNLYIISRDTKYLLNIILFTLTLLAGSRLLFYMAADLLQLSLVSRVLRISILSPCYKKQ